MNFLWCNSYYTGNTLFNYADLIGPLLIFIFIFSFYKKLSSKINIKNKFLNIFCKFLVVVILFFVAFFINFFVNIFSIFTRIEEPDDGCICGCIEGSYDTNKYFHAYRYFIMCFFLYLNLGRLYWSILWKKIKSRKKRKNIIITFIIFSIIFIGVTFGIYNVLDYYAPEFEIYRSSC